ncbi:hypothetical protein LLJ53_11095 [Pseudomonas aeruginosa]|uniref:hypothetical protein n=1 Tax=Pseudomonas aeruginosa TaxID=287 RepID=UPI0021E4B93C|nr:hypothetical protein [Pseudomonas aeruginosa]UYF86550.1 hypothetical protein LLJ53_11095 [Pseudomonas aeruginosa]
MSGTNKTLAKFLQQRIAKSKEFEKKFHSTRFLIEDILISDKEILKQVLRNNRALEDEEKSIRHQIVGDFIIDTKLGAVLLSPSETDNPIEFFKSKKLQQFFSYVEIDDKALIHDIKNNVYLYKDLSVDSYYQKLKHGEEIKDGDGKQIEIMGFPLTADTETIVTLGMMCDDFSKVNIVEPSSPTPPEPAPAPVLQKPKFSRERVVMTLCELYKNNETNPREHADFRRRFDRQTDPLMKEPTFRPADLYTGKEAVLAALKGLPEVRKIELAKDKDSLYTLLNEQFRKAHSTVDHFEKKFGKVDEFIPEASEQVIAFLAFYSHRNTISHKDLMERVIGAFEKASTLPAFNADFNTPEKLDTVKAQLRTAFEKLDIPEQESKFTFKYK